MRSKFILWLTPPAVAVGLMLGCRGDVELLEARLRQQAEALAEADRQLAQQADELAEARRSQWLLERQMAEISKGTIVPEQVTLPARVSAVAIDAKFSGIVPSSDVSQSDQISLVFYPVDSKGAAVRIPGRVVVRCRPASEIARASSTEVVIPIDESLQHWRSAIIGAGYQFEMDAPGTSTSRSKWSLELEFTTSDGRVFKDDIELQAYLGADQATRSERPTGR